MFKKAKPKGKLRPASALQGRIKGREAGYPKGWNYGFHMGQCDVALSNKSHANTIIKSWNNDTGHLQS